MSSRQSWSNTTTKKFRRNHVHHSRSRRLIKSSPLKRHAISIEHNKSLISWLSRKQPKLDSLRQEKWWCSPTNNKTISMSPKLTTILWRLIIHANPLWYRMRLFPVTCMVKQIKFSINRLKMMMITMYNYSLIVASNWNRSLKYWLYA